MLPLSICQMVFTSGSRPSADDNGPRVTYFVPKDSAFISCTSFWTAISHSAVAKVCQSCTLKPKRAKNPALP